MKTAWLFAGQGSQTVGMGADIYEQYPQTRVIFDSAAADFDLAELSFSGPAERLNDTRYTQAAMAAFAAAVTLLLKEAAADNGSAVGSPAYVAGLSLGEYCALHASGVLDVEQLLSLLAVRGAAMADAAADVDSRMVAVLGLADEQVEQAVARAQQADLGVVSCANYNAPGQVVVGGQTAAVELAEQFAKEQGAKRILPLNTSGPFHTQLMLPAAKVLEVELAKREFAPQQVPVVFNTIAEPAPDADIKSLLVRQVAEPVRFAQSIRWLEVQGVERIIEIGPGKVLTGLVRKTAPSIQTISIQTADDLGELIEQ